MTFIKASGTDEAKEHTQSNLFLLEIKLEKFKLAYCDELELNDLIEQRISTMMKILLREKPDIILLQQIETFPLTLYD
ncbi:unnamed protein product [Rotaria sordida]|uniref:Uncharacterized protein n=2 Tax=Rotaria sordida TaxID=392033 RepID=A0A815ULR5_9BILA|nr:unnamed protein product [Rotaria sordida]CAF1515587.1 unnamed protein product [Rotaria sordida]CAF1660022.1 unnamed protein product [Rotaria sordida]CAF4310704.1 unnamed protein product [Rotaria sordida]